MKKQNNTEWREDSLIPHNQKVCTQKHRCTLQGGGCTKSLFVYKINNHITNCRKYHQVLTVRKSGAVQGCVAPGLYTTGDKSRYCIRLVQLQPVYEKGKCLDAFKTKILSGLHQDWVITIITNAFYFQYICIFLVDKAWEKKEFKQDTLQFGWLSQSD